MGNAYIVYSAFLKLSYIKRDKLDSLATLRMNSDRKRQRRWQRGSLLTLAVTDL